jgi:hypothetical protein
MSDSTHVEGFLLEQLESRARIKSRGKNGFIDMLISNFFSVSFGFKYILFENVYGKIIKEFKNKSKF